MTGGIGKVENILKLADALGEALRDSDRFKRLKELEEKVSADPEAGGLLKSFAEKSNEIRHKEMHLQPVEVAEKRVLMDIQEKIQKNAIIMDMLRAQADYAEIINKVNERIFGRLEK
jgi:cell fate (sporulation/competence/biofilm development) regulator YlbF (YheA/YmcA/DUF963 family)